MRTLLSEGVEVLDVKNHVIPIVSNLSLRMPFSNGISRTYSTLFICLVLHA
jgi:hypothetical protein